MNEFIVRTFNLKELEKHSTIKYKANLLNIVFIETKLSIDEVKNIEGVYSVEVNDILGTLCG